jgi:hypothetical protein
MNRNARTVEIPLFRATEQQKANIWFCRPICYMNDMCDEITCRAYQKENKDTGDLCYLKGE